MKNLNLSELYGKQSIDIQCPSCDHKFKVKFDNLLKNNNIIKCSNCNNDIKIEHDSTTKKTLHDTDKALKDFEKSLKKLFK